MYQIAQMNFFFQYTTSFEFLLSAVVFQRKNYDHNNRDMKSRLDCDTIKTGDKRQGVEGKKKVYQRSEWDGTT